jgi:hypothetical protein
MIIDLDKLNTGTWFPLEGGGQICLRVCAGDDYRTIHDQCVTSRREVVFDKAGKAQVVREEITNDRLLSELLWDFSIVDWTDLLDAKGTAIPCTKDMKLLLMGKSPKFSGFVGDCLKKLRDLEEQEAGAADANLPSG